MALKSDGPIEARVSVHLNRVSLPDALIAIQQASGAVISYSKAILPHAWVVSLDVEDVPVSEAVRRALEGTDIRITRRQDGNILLFRATASAAAGIVTGRVTDAKTKGPMRGASVVLDDTVMTTRTNEAGEFRFANVPAGTHRVTVRLIGYRRQIKVLEVVDNQATSVDFTLQSSVNALDQVVVTATGQQRRVELGNVIAHLNVDSIAPTAPVTSLTDLLAARAPGVQVVETNGLVGGSRSIRIRGESSMLITGDPIVIVDGVRQDNSPGGANNQIFGATPTPSRLNDIDVNQIQTIDILKGPAASTEYGTDAANGVIVITTKRGTAGPPQWRLSAEHGWSEIPSDFPDFYYTYGHTAAAPATPIQCPAIYVSSFLKNAADQSCIADSVIHDNPLNHSATSIYQHGLRQNVDLSVSGGSDITRYFVAGGTSRDVGTTHMPSVFHSQAIALGFPGDVFDPNSQTQRSARANLTTHLGPRADLFISSAYLSTNQQVPGGSSLTHSQQIGPVVLDSAHDYGYGCVSCQRSETPLTNLGQLQSESTTRAIGGATADWHPAEWFTLHGSAGIDHGTQESKAIFLPQAFYVFLGLRNFGSLQVTNTTTDIASGDVRGAIVHALTPDLRSTTSFGLQTVSTRMHDIVASANGLSDANTSLNGVPNPQVSQGDDGHATVGGYLEQQMGIADRVFVIGALRLDGASGFGHDYHTTVYPKLSVSWLALNTGATTVRVRGAFGAAGQQPDNGAALQLSRAQSVFVDGQQVSGSVLIGPGNPHLKPERSQELEGGVDVSLFDSRINLEVTGYRKQTRDALVNVPLGITLDNLSMQENLGDVQNRGVEASVQATVIRRNDITWDVTVNASSNTNTLLRLAPGVTGLSAGGVSGQQFRVGYPLYGYWARRATYDDADGNGVLLPSEVTVEDTNSYMGASSPRVEASLSTQLSVLRGLVTFGSLFDIKAGDVVSNLAAATNASHGTLPEQNVSNAPLWLQARALSWSLTADRSSLFYETGRFVRWREASMTFNVPVSWTRRMRTSSLTVTAAVRNLGLWSHYSGVDPEVSDAGVGQVNGSQEVNGSIRGIGGASVPLPRTWLIRVNAGL